MLFSIFWARNSSKREGSVWICWAKFAVAWTWRDKLSPQRSHILIVSLTWRPRSNRWKRSPLPHWWWLLKLIMLKWWEMGLNFPLLAHCKALHRLRGWVFQLKPVLLIKKAKEKIPYWNKAQRKITKIPLSSQQRVLAGGTNCRTFSQLCSVMRKFFHNTTGSYARKK